MSIATLTLKGDSSSIISALVGVRETSKGVVASLVADWRRVGAAVDDAAKVQERAAKRAAAAVISEERKAGAEREKIEKRASAVAAAEGQTRAQGSAREGAAKGASARRGADDASAAEATHTRATERESAKRIAAARREAAEQKKLAREMAAAIGTAAGTVAQTAGAVHAAIQEPRARQAEIEDTFNRAFANAGITDQAEIARHRETAYRFVTSGAGRGMDLQEIARSALDVQGQFSSLTAAPRPGETSEQAHSRAFGTFLQAAAFGRNSGQEFGAMTRLSAALGTGNAALAPADLEVAMRTVTGIGRAGGLPADMMTAEAFGPLQSRINTALGALPRGATAAQRSAAVIGATSNVAAELAILKPLGGSVASNAAQLATLQQTLPGDVQQGLLLNRLRRRGATGQAEAAKLFEGARGHEHLRARYQDVMELGDELTTFAGSPTALRNLIGKGNTRGDRQMVFRLPVQGIMGLLAGRDADGNTGFRRARRIQQGAGVTTENLNATTDMFRNEDRSTLQAEQEEGERNAREPGLLRDTSDRVAGLWRKHRVGLSIASGLGTLLAGATAATLGTAAGVGVFAGEGINRGIYSDRDRANGPTSILQGNTWHGGWDLWNASGANPLHPAEGLAAGAQGDAALRARVNAAWHAQHPDAGGGLPGGGAHPGGSVPVTIAAGGAPLRVEVVAVHPGVQLTANVPPHAAAHAESAAHGSRSLARRQ